MFAVEAVCRRNILVLVFCPATTDNHVVEPSYYSDKLLCIEERSASFLRVCVSVLGKD